jgi:hypothetical protein
MIIEKNNIVTIVGDLVGTEIIGDERVMNDTKVCFLFREKVFMYPKEGQGTKLLTFCLKS